MAYTDSSASARLTAVRTAINAILDGAQSYTVLGMQFNRGNLRTLIDLERRIMNEANSAARTTPAASYAKCRKQL